MIPPPARRKASTLPGQRGQATTEYALGLVAVVLVLFVPLFDGRSVAGALANAVRDAYATFSYLVSLC